MNLSAFFSNETEHLHSNFKTTDNKLFPIQKVLFSLFSAVCFFGSTPKDCF